MVTETSSLTLCKECIDSHRSFVLQGGAGSGKTEALKELLSYIENKKPQARVVCITHTNAAVAEIINRVGDKFQISTIHSFLYGIIGNYKKNIKVVISKLFIVPLMVRKEQDSGISQTEYKKAEYANFKKVYEQYASKLYSISHETCDKVVGKREYDGKPTFYNQLLNDKIRSLNKSITEIIDKREYSSVFYNETKFNSFRELSYGHDGLLDIFHLLFKEYPLLGKVISDKYDYLFIDEYQDTRAVILDDFLQLCSNTNLTIGLFGDSMQSIYDDGIGGIDTFVNGGMLQSISIRDNYRCSYEVIDLITQLRLDDIKQEVAFKKHNNKSVERESDRHGIVKVFYSVIENKPNSHSSIEEKDRFQKIIDFLISKAKTVAEDSKVLMLTNKAIAEKNGFQLLYKTFNDRFVDVNDRIEDYLRSTQALDVTDLCLLFINKDFNGLIKTIRKAGYIIHTVSDKTKLHDLLQRFVDDPKLSLVDAVNLAIEQKLIKQTETYQNIIDNNESYLHDLSDDERFQKYKELYSLGNNTYNKIKDFGIVSSEEEFRDYENQLKKERFLLEIRSSRLHFSEVLNYAKYLNEDTNYITMHKTKGTSIPSVIVVMEEFFWNEYDFSLLYAFDEQKIQKHEKSQRLIYVACSRAKNNLICLRVITPNEVESFKMAFPAAEEIDIPSTVFASVQS